MLAGFHEIFTCALCTCWILCSVHVSWLCRKEKVFPAHPAPSPGGMMRYVLDKQLNAGYTLAGFHLQDSALEGYQQDSWPPHVKKKDDRAAVLS